MGDLRRRDVSLLFFLGPVYVLMPYVVKNSLHGGAEGLGLVFSAGGVGAIVAALLRGHLGLPRRPLTVVYVAWAATAFSLVGYALATAVWQAMIVSFFSLACLTTGGIVWTTVLQRSVPARMIGRVSSVDWVLSLALAPVSYALIVPISNALGARTTLLWSGVIGGAVMLVVLLAVPDAAASASAKKRHSARLRPRSFDTKPALTRHARASSVGSCSRERSRTRSSASSRGAWTSRSHIGQRHSGLRDRRSGRPGGAGGEAPRSGAASRRPSWSGRTGASRSTSRRRNSARRAPASTCRSRSRSSRRRGRFPAERLTEHAAVGELGLDGRLRRVGGVLAVAEGATRPGSTG